MHSETVILAQHILMVLLVILAVGIVGAKLAETINIPDVVIFLLIGILIGPEFIGLIDVSVKSVLNQAVLLFGASLILFHGGMVTQFAVLRSVWLSITLLSTTGLLITALIVAMSAVWILHTPFLVALLLGALLASTDPAALIPIFRKYPIRPKVAQTVISESAFTDATGAILTSVVFGLLISGQVTGPGHIIVQFLQLSVGGVIVGVIVGWMAAFLISERERDFLREYTPVVIILAVLVSYLLAETIHASGFMSVFVAGLIIGNASSLRVPIGPKEENSAHQFVDMLSLKLRMLIFIILGSQVDFGILAQYALAGIVIAFVFMFIARPLTVLASVLVDRKAKWTMNEILFLLWTRETGVIAAALVGIISSSSLAQGKLISSIAFLAILITLIIQASTTPWLAKKLGLMQPLGEPSSQLVERD